MAVRLDEMDRKILAELQLDAEQSLDEIARILDGKAPKKIVVVTDRIVNVVV